MTNLTKSLIALTALFSMAWQGQTSAQDVAEIKITADKTTFIYDIKEFTVKAGQKVKLTFINPKDSINLQPHNLIIIKPGKMQAMLALVNDPANFADPNWIKNPLPKSDDILWHTKLLAVGEEETLEFTAPSEPGDYPYLCSYIGHAILMNGMMKVEK